MQIGVLIGVVAVADGAHGVAVDDPEELEAGEPAVDVCKEELLGTGVVPSTKAEAEAPPSTLRRVWHMACWTSSNVQPFTVSLSKRFGRVKGEGQAVPVGIILRSSEAGKVAGSKLLGAGRSGSPSPVPGGS